MARGRAAGWSGLQFIAAMARTSVSRPQLVVRSNRDIICRHPLDIFKFVERLNLSRSQTVRGSKYTANFVQSGTDMLVRTFCLIYV